MFDIPADGGMEELQGIKMAATSPGHILIPLALEA